MPDVNQMTCLPFRIFHIKISHLNELKKKSLLRQTFSAGWRERYHIAELFRESLRWDVINLCLLSHFLPTVPKQQHSPVRVCHGGATPQQCVNGADASPRPYSTVIKLTVSNQWSLPSNRQPGLELEIWKCSAHMRTMWGGGIGVARDLWKAWLFRVPSLQVFLH